MMAYGKPAEITTKILILESQYSTIFAVISATNLCPVHSSLGTIQDQE